MKSETMWAITGDRGDFVYCGTYLTRNEAIRDHALTRKIRRREDWSVKKLWNYCRRQGDRAVKVTITWDQER